MKLSDNIQSAMKSDEPAPPVSAVTGYVVKSVRRDGKVLTDVNHYYTGDVLELGVKCLPENADTSKLYFERGFDESENYINVEENGEVTLSKWGYHRVVIKSKDNPDNVLYDLKIYNEGVNPDKVKGIKAEIHLGSELVKAVDGIITLKTCEEYFLSVTAETDDEYNGYGVSTIETKILIDGKKHNENDKIFFLSAKQWFYPLKPTDGDSTLNLEIKLGDKTVSQKSESWKARDRKPRDSFLMIIINASQKRRRLVQPYNEKRRTPGHHKPTRLPGRKRKQRRAVKHNQQIVRFIRRQRLHNAPARI